MAVYSDALVELGNQAWILNLALAELQGVKVGVESHIRSQPATHCDLTDNLERQLTPAIARLQTRLQALLSKWQRRMVEESAEMADFFLQSEVWGCRLALPALVRQQLQVESKVQVSLAEAQALASAHPEQFFTVASPLSGVALASLDASDTLVTLNRYSGMDVSVAKMWWSWCLDQTLLQCRLQVLSDNLWQSDCCTAPAKLTRPAVSI